VQPAVNLQRHYNVAPTAIIDTLIPRETKETPRE
jgi:hypothetical protein